MPMKHSAAQNSSRCPPARQPRQSSTKQVRLVSAQRAYTTAAISGVLSPAECVRELPGLLVAGMDQVTDPHEIGRVLRSQPVEHVTQLCGGRLVAVRVHRAGSNAGAGKL